MKGGGHVALPTTQLYRTGAPTTHALPSIADSRQLVIRSKPTLG